jgi:hypothetical protein
MTRRGLVAAFVSALALALPATAAASVTLVDFTSPVQRGSAALLVVRVTGAPRKCTIAAFHKGRAWHAKGLAAKLPSAGLASWAWQVGSLPGRFRLLVSCGSAGSLTATLVVTR